jgi:WD40 repeat protein
MRASLLILGALALIAGGAASGASLETHLQPPPEHGGFFALAFSPDGKTVAGGTGRGEVGEIRGGREIVTQTFGGEVLLWDASTGRLERTLGRHGGSVNWLRFSRDGRTLASASEDDATLKLWDTGTGRLVRTFDGARLPGLRDGMLPFPSLSLESMSLVTVGDKRTRGKDWQIDEPQDLTVWDIATGQARWRVSRSDVRRIAFSPDGKVLATSEAHVDWTFDAKGEPSGTVTDPRVVLRSARTGQVLRTLPRQSEAQTIAFLPDGKTLAILSVEDAELWDTRAGTLRRTPLSLPHEILERLAFAPEGRRVGFLYTDYSSQPYRRRVEVRSVATGELEASLVRADLPGGPGAFAPDLRRLACVSGFQPAILAVPPAEGMGSL